ncbi:MAG: aconitate hydratase AcnA [Candidatus Melainabacteria bacterium]|nr:aconitate hydratase AcnA [Candidatus Melainabacteria bacterium]
MLIEKSVLLDEINLSSSNQKYKFYSLRKIEELTQKNLASLPFSLKIILESMLRNLDEKKVRTVDIQALLDYDPKKVIANEVPFSPARVVLQDFTGVPLFVDLAAMRDAAKKVGLDPQKINPLVPLDLVIDHSIQVDSFGTDAALEQNQNLEFDRNYDRFQFLKWAQKAFNQTRIVPPGFGIIHQVNMEYLAKVVLEKDNELFFDTLVGTDSHTTMIGGLGIFGFGVGGLEAEAAMLGQPVTMPAPEVVGIKLKGSLSPVVTATDLALYVTEFLRKIGVIGKLVEFYGDGCKSLTLEERATVSNMAPEYGATVGLFPVDEEVLNYLNRTGRSAEDIEKVEKYFKAQGVWGTERNEASFTALYEINLDEIQASVAGPRRPQDRINFSELKSQFAKAIARPTDEHGFGLKEANPAEHGDILIAAITSCTNTSNPAVIIAAGLVAQKAIAKGLKVNAKVKTSLAPGSQAVREYLEKADLLAPLEQLGFNIVGYGCTTCIGNSGPLSSAAMEAVNASPDKVFASVLSGNRNFDGRISPQIKANFLMSPPLVVAMALRGNVNFDPENDFIQADVKLKDIWPTKDEVKAIIEKVMSPEIYKDIYSKVSQGTALWNSINADLSSQYEWDDKNTYIQNPPFFEEFGINAPSIKPIEKARVLLSLGDSITTDHISPAGSIAKDSSAAKYLNEESVANVDFNSYGSRRGNDRVMTRGTFANIRLANLLVPNSSGPVTKHFSDAVDFESAPQLSVFDASLKYKETGTPCLVFAGKLFGNGSSRDWAAKGQMLLGVKAVIAESFERIHRSNLIGMGILPIEVTGKVLKDNGLDGSEEFSIEGLNDNIVPSQEIKISAKKKSGETTVITAKILLQTPIEIEYYRHGGILQFTLRQLIRENSAQVV